MDSDQVNKILMAVMFTCLGLLSLNIAAGAIFTPTQPAKPGYDIAVQEHPAAGDHGAAPPAAPQPIEVLLASSSPERGESAAKPCLACHSFEKGGPNKVGPNLWNVVGRPKASVAGLQLLGRDEGQGRQLDLRRAQQVPGQPQGLRAGHRHDLRGPAARYRSAPT